MNCCFVVFNTEFGRGCSYYLLEKFVKQLSVLIAYGSAYIGYRHIAFYQQAGSFGDSLFFNVFTQAFAAGFFE